MLPSAQRPYAIAKYLDKEKYKVTVITCGNPDSCLGFDPDFNDSLKEVSLIKIDSFLWFKLCQFKNRHPQNLFWASEL